MKVLPYLEGELKASENQYAMADGMEDNVAAVCRSLLATNRILLSIAESLATINEEMVEQRVLRYGKP